MRGRRPRKELGQHFLRRSEACAPLIDYLAPRGRPVLEIGPGEGALSVALLGGGARVLALEIDPRWAFEAARRFAGDPFEVAVADATRFAWERLPAGSLVAGNLPYNVATRILLRMLESTLAGVSPVERAAVLVQREVAERLVARPGDPGYGSLSVLVAVLARARRLGNVAPGAFRPPPKVESAFVGLEPRRLGISSERYPGFKVFVRTAFAQRRKTLRNALAAGADARRAERFLAAAALEPRTRAESLTPEEFVNLLQHWEKVAPDPPSAAPP